MLLSLALAAPGSVIGAQVPVEALRLMEVEGDIVIGVDGSVRSAVVTTRDVSAALRDSLVSKAMRWRFPPLKVAGQPVQVQTRFSAVLGAVPDGDRFKVRIEGVTFGGHDDKDGVHLDGVPERFKPRSIPLIWYPLELANRGRTGVVVRLMFRQQIDFGEPGYWIPVMRGPRHPVAWLPPERTTEVAIAAGGSSGSVPDDSRLRLLEPATGTTLD